MSPFILEGRKKLPPEAAASSEEQYDQHRQLWADRRTREPLVSRLHRGVEASQYGETSLTETREGADQAMGASGLPAQINSNDRECRPSCGRWRMDMRSCTRAASIQQSARLGLQPHKPGPRHARRGYAPSLALCIFDCLNFGAHSTLTFSLSDQALRPDRFARP